MVDLHRKDVVGESNVCDSKILKAHKKGAPHAGSLQGDSHAGKVRALSSTCKAKAHKDASMGVLRHLGLIVQDPGPSDGRRPFGYAQPYRHTLMSGPDFTCPGSDLLGYLYARPAAAIHL